MIMLSMLAFTIIIIIGCEICIFFFFVSVFVGLFAFIQPAHRKYYAIVEQLKIVNIRKNESRNNQCTGDRRLQP